MQSLLPAWNFEGNQISTTGSSLQRKIDWTGAFWVASGVPALVLFSMGAVAASVGRPAWFVWTASIIIGFIQSLIYAEMAGLFPNKSGGASVYGALAWVKYSKFVAPVSVWCHWLAWSPVLAIGSGLLAGSALSLLFPPDAWVNTWQWTLLDLNVLKSGLTLRVNATFLLGALILLSSFAVQHGGILRSARTTMALAAMGLLPLIFLALTPLFKQGLNLDHFFPFVPLAHHSEGVLNDGHWDMAGWTVLAGGLFVAAWSTYSMETAISYTREFEDPQRDTFKAALYIGVLCIFVFVMLPIAFQSYLGLGDIYSVTGSESIEGLGTRKQMGLLAPEIYSGTGVPAVLTAMIGGGLWVQRVTLLLLASTLALTIMTALSGSSRTLYQASVDGWLPKYLSRVNANGAPIGAMLTDLVFNLLLLLMSDYVFVLAASNVSYIIFNFLNLNACWIHRIDRAERIRPFKVSKPLLAIGVFLAFFNLVLMGFGADLWGPGTLLTGAAFSGLILPVFIYRHYFQDRGVFPKDAVEDMPQLGGEGLRAQAGVLPYLTLACGLAVVLICYQLAVR
jgi:amino acid transporter